MGHRMMVRTVVSLAGLVVALAGTVSVAVAQVSSIVWHEVGDPGNEAWDDEDYNYAKFYGRGQVNRRYRMSETELTVGQWVEFVRAYGPHADHPFGSELLGYFIGGRYVDGVPQYEVAEGFEDYPTFTSWRMGARFANWMHNGRSAEAWAFESGVYDTSTFTRNDEPPPYYNDQTTRSPGARYWIPSMDEWMKAVYYDPNRYGEGQGGWWEQPNGSDTILISDLPENGGQTNAGLFGNLFNGGSPLAAGSYPDVRTPWGLLDASGGLAEWTEEWRWSDYRQQRHLKSSNWFDDFVYGEEDWIGAQTRTWDPMQSWALGIRVAAAVPSPPFAAVGAVAFALYDFRRRS